MILQGVNIKRLFGQFDYDISLINQEGITILTGPNGYGKTTVLRIIDALFSTNFNFFQILNFEKIMFLFSDNKTIIVTKGKPMPTQQRISQIVNGHPQIILSHKIFANITLEMKDNGKTVVSYIYTPDEEDKLLQAMVNNLPYPDIILQFMKNQPISGFEVDTDELQNQLRKKSFEIIFSGSKNNDTYSALRSMLISSKIYFIQEQRLIKQIALLTPTNKSGTTETTLVYTIETLAKDLQKLIAAKQTEAFQAGQKLDSTFPKRILQQKTKLAEDEFSQRVKILSDKQEKLRKFGITVSDPVTTGYDKEKADVLSVYLEDSEKKVAVFDDIISKINLFVTILDNKQLTNKSMVINAKEGFYIKTLDNRAINLSLLSSGEQQEIVLLYELLFKTEPNTLILIDEPEISLHVMWQKNFVKDLLAIAKIKKISFFLATHSPQIINGRWDLVTDLYTLATKKENPDFGESDAG